MTDTAPLALGDLARDIITSFEGVVLARTTFLHGCDRLYLAPRALTPDGKPIEPTSFDDKRLVPVERGVVAVEVPTPRLPMGAMARDTITGFEGRIVGIQRHMTGVVFYTLEPTSLKADGDLRDAQPFEEERIAIIQEMAVPVSPNADAGKTGGPQRHDKLAR